MVTLFQNDLRRRAVDLCRAPLARVHIALTFHDHVMTADRSVGSIGESSFWRLVWKWCAQ